ncbi:alginate lyase [Thermostilla marina]
MGAEIPLDERPAGPGEWGYRPTNDSVLVVSPPNFAWRPQKGINHWEIQVAGDESFSEIVYSADDINWNVHTPPVVLPSKTYWWRYRGWDDQSRHTAWSRPRRFRIASGATAFPMPTRKELLARIPDAHPRLFLRPEDLPRLRQAAKGELADAWQAIKKQCDEALRNPPPTKEPPRYPDDIEPRGEAWREIWWGNRTYTQRALGTAAELGFAYQISGDRRYGEAARRILMECAKWDPHGATGYRYNDEAGMPYAYFFSRTYTYVYDLLNESERQTCRDVMKARGEEMYRHLCPRHLWQPYASHSNRAYHFLGEIGVAFHGEIAEADDWTWFAVNVFYNVYPVWSDDDGGWHEGASYWNSYITRFTWWADVMRAAFGVDAYRKPYFSKAGYYAMYFMPPFSETGGFGDLACTREARANVPLVSILAAQAGNPYWQWYVDTMGGSPPKTTSWDFVRGALPATDGKPPVDLPTSRVFRGTGQAVLNTTLTDGRDNVQVQFKSSPFGTQSHGYDANNAFLLSAYNQRLFVSSGRRDMYGSAHHRDWMWSTRSVNSITVDGIGQIPHSAACRGRITAFSTSPTIDIVEGEAGGCYQDTKAPQGDSSVLKRFTRTIIFCKPELVVVYDRLEASRPVRYEYWLHSPNRMELDDNRLTASSGEVVCPVEFLAPRGLHFEQTNQYDPNPRPRITLREWHLMASTTEKARSVEFVALYRPHKKGTSVGHEATLRQVDGGYILTAELADGTAELLLPLSGEATVRSGDLATHGQIVVRRRFSDGRPDEMQIVDGIQ